MLLAERGLEGLSYKPFGAKSPCWRDEARNQKGAAAWQTQPLIRLARLPTGAYVHATLKIKIPPLICRYDRVHPCVTYLGINRAATSFITLT